MSHNSLIVALASTGLFVACTGQPGNAPQPATSAAGMSGAAPERAIRRDIPITNMIQRAFAAGTRDSTGRPGGITGSCAPTTRSTRDSIRQRPG